MSQRSVHLPPTRAITLFARTVYRQLKHSGNERTDFVEFINELLDQISAEPGLGPMTGITDVETALPNLDALLDVLEHEIKRAAHGASTLLICCDVELPDSSHDDAASAIHILIARQLRRGVRANDAIARLGLSRYGIVLPGATVDLAPTIVNRLLGPVISPRRRDDILPEGTRVSIRIAATVGSSESAVELVARCANEPPTELALPTEPTDAPRLVRTVPPPSAPTHEFDAVVLALGGGAARAAAHIGVLRAFEGRGARVAGVAGSSAGALIGAMVMTGMKHDAILDRFVAFPASSLYREMRRRFVLFRRASSVPRRSMRSFRESGLAFLSNERLAAFDDSLLEAFVEFFVGPDRDMSTLVGPFVVAATDLVRGRSVHIAHGPLHQALRASCALPGLFAPQRDGDRFLVDGSTVAEVPVRAAVSLGLTLPVVGVHLARPERDITAFATSSEVLFRSAAVLRKELVREQLRHAHRLVTAPVDEIGWLDFRRAADTAMLGEQAALAHLERWMPSATPASHE